MSLGVNSDQPQNDSVASFGEDRRGRTVSSAFLASSNKRRFTQSMRYNPFPFRICIASSVMVLWRPSERKTALKKTLRILGIH